MRKDPIEVVASDPFWVEEGHAYAERVASALDELAMRVDHVGSTAVPRLEAKDVIDIQALVFRLDDVEIVNQLKAAGFRHAPDNTGDPANPDATPALGDDDWRKLYFREPNAERRVHIHVRRNGAAGARQTLLMRDYLRDDEAARRDYGAFKLALARKTRRDRDAYQAIKGPFISTVLRAAEGWAELTRWQPGAPDAYWRSAQ